MVYFCMFFNNKEYKDKVMESYVIHRALARGEISSEDYKRGDFFQASMLPASLTESSRNTSFMSMGEICSDTITLGTALL